MYTHVNIIYIQAGFCWLAYRSVSSSRQVLYCVFGILNGLLKLLYGLIKRQDTNSSAGFWGVSWLIGTCQQLSSAIVGAWSLEGEGFGVWDCGFDMPVVYNAQVLARRVERDRDRERERERERESDRRFLGRLGYPGHYQGAIPCACWACPAAIMPPAVKAIFFRTLSECQDCLKQVTHESSSDANQG